MSERNWTKRGIAMVISSVALLALAGSSPAHAGGLISSPSHFEVDYGGDIASDRGRLILTVTGLTKQGDVRTQLFARQGSKWRTASRQFPSAYRAGNNVYFVRFRGIRRLVPCMNYMGRDDEVRFRCRPRRHWRLLQVDRSLENLGRFVEASVVRGRLVAWFVGYSKLNAKPQTTKVRIARQRGWRIIPRGPLGVFRCRCWGALGQQTTDARSGLVDVAMGALYTTRFVATLGPNGWSRVNGLPAPVRPSIVGSQFGTVRTAQDLFVPVHTMSWEEPWTLSVYGRKKTGPWSQLGGADLNEGARNAQGAIVPVGKRVWAIWEEYPEENTDNPTMIYAALINQAGTRFGRTLTLRSGPFGFMTGYDAVGFRGGTVFLYTRSFNADNRRARLAVDMSYLRR